MKIIKKIIKYIFFKIHSIGQNEQVRRRGIERKTFLKESLIVDSSTWISDSSQIYNFQKNRSQIEIGKCSSIMGELVIFPYGGKIKIGDNCFVGPGSRIWSGESIAIGNNVLIGHNVNVIDFSHEADAADRSEGFRNFFKNSHPLEKGKIPTRQIVIEEDVIIYAGVSIVMGVTIGRGSIISTGSIVIKDVPPFSLALGNPAKVVWKTK